MHIGRVWDIFVHVTETASVISTRLDISMTTEGALNSVGVRMSSQGWEPVKPALLPRKVLPTVFQLI